MSLVSISIQPENPTLRVGSSVQFSVIGYEDDGSISTPEVLWESSDANVIYINTSGLATMVSPGSATITASTSGITGLVASSTEPQLRYEITGGILSSPLRFLLAINPIPTTVLPGTGFTVSPVPVVVNDSPLTVIDDSITFFSDFGMSELVGVNVFGQKMFTGVESSPTMIPVEFSDSGYQVIVTPLISSSLTLTVSRQLHSWSHTTQALQNYFDPKDARVREVPYTIDSQLLNVVAGELDDLELKVDRELSGRSLGRSPAAIDNRGIYYQVRVPADFVLPTEGEPDPVIEGSVGLDWVPLSPFDDTLPVPTSVVRDPSIEPVALTNPCFLDITGVGDVMSATPGALSFPNQVTFWVEGLQGFLGWVYITIEGERHPRPAWANERAKTTEVISIREAGRALSRMPWAVIDKLTVRNLPSGARLRAWCLPVALPLVEDTGRPYSHPGYRDRLLRRYWQVEGSNRLLTERYLLNNFSDFEYAQSYATGRAWVDLAIEPYTWGMYAASTDALYYLDRREPLPAYLREPGLTREPVYGLSLEYAIERHGSARWLWVKPVSYQKASGVQYRIIMREPTGVEKVILPNGMAGTYNASAGWSTGIPKPVLVPLTRLGTYVFSIECLDAQRQISVDRALYNNLLAVPIASFDLNGLVPEVKGLAFDYLHRLWVWTGTHAICLRPSYRGYVIDHETSSVFVTDLFDQVRFS